MERITIRLRHVILGCVMHMAHWCVILNVILFVCSCGRMKW